MVEIGSKIINPKKHISNENLKNKLLAPNLVVPAYILSQGGLKNWALSEEFDEFENYNPYLHQSKITLPGSQWDTLY